MLLAQLTVTNDAIITGNFNVQLFVNGQSNVENSNGIPFSSQEGAIFGCMDPDATNYNPDATSQVSPVSMHAHWNWPSPRLRQTHAPVLPMVESPDGFGGQLGVLFGLDGDDHALAVGIFDGLVGGTYTVSAIDGAGCAGGDVEIVAPDPIVISASMADP